MWPVKQKYGQKISWADLLVLAGNVALESMGFKTFGFAFGREDVWEPEEINWGSEDTWLGDERYSGERDLSNPLGAVQMGLIYVNPEGPNGNPDPLASARDIRDTFARMAMNDEETVALIAGGHTFGKTHGAGNPELVGPEPEGAPLEAQGLGWLSSYGTGKGADAITSGLEVTWTDRPTEWSNRFFEILFGYEWEAHREPGRRQAVGRQGRRGDHPRPGRGLPEAQADHADQRPRAALRPGVREDLAPVPGEPRRVRAGLRQGLVQVCSTATWARSSATSARGCPRRRLWQDPVPAVDHPLVDDADVADLKAKVLDSGLTVAEPGLHRVGLRGVVPLHGQARRCQRRPDPVRPAQGLGGQPARAGSPRSSAKLEEVKAAFDAQGEKKISLADLIVLAGSAGVEKAAKDGGYDVTVPFTPGRTDATEEQTDAESFAVLEPRADGFRNYARPGEKSAAGDAAARPCVHAGPDGSRVDRPAGRTAHPRHQRRRLHCRRAHRQARCAVHRLLHQPARARRGREGLGDRGARLRDP
ncbi:peroxidase family protein [Nocardioides convexus]|uniref:peroxidase family protein n=1 Tax=Nocardioides convexus TaxID=2712224 RepID=UPI003100D002